MTLPTTPEAECTVCKTAFLRMNTMQQVCSVKCAIRIPVVSRRAKLAAEKEQRRKDRAARERLKSRREWLSEAQTAFNAYIRERDAKLPCISCGRMHTGQWHAGHYLSTGARPELRFDEDNCHKQCQPCNTHLHGNLVLYRAELIRRIGQEAVNRLEGPHTPAKWTSDDLREIRDRYRAKARSLKE